MVDLRLSFYFINLSSNCFYIYISFDFWIFIVFVNDFVSLLYKSW